MDDYRAKRCLSGQPADIEAHLQGILAEESLDRGIVSSIRGLMELRSAAKLDPASGLALARRLIEGQVAPRPARIITASQLLQRTIEMGRNRFSGEISVDVYDRQEQEMRRMVADALIMRGKLFDRYLRLPDQARNFYEEAITIDRAPKAHMALGLLHFWGSLWNAKATLALRHFRTAIALGELCRGGEPDCRCAFGYLVGLEGVPADRLETDIVLLRAQAREGRLGHELPATEGLDRQAAFDIEVVIDGHFDRMDPNASILPHFSFVASIVASTIAMQHRSQRDVLACLRLYADGMMMAQHMKPLIEDGRDEFVGHKECVAYSKSHDATLVFGLVHATMVDLVKILQRVAPDQTALVAQHAIKNCFYRIGRSWRANVIEVAAASFLMDKNGEVIRFVIPAAIGDPERVRISLGLD